MNWITTSNVFCFLNILSLNYVLTFMFNSSLILDILQCICIIMLFMLHAFCEPCYSDNSNIILRCNITFKLSTDSALSVNKSITFHSCLLFVSFFFWNLQMHLYNDVLNVLNDKDLIKVVLFWHKVKIPISVEIWLLFFHIITTVL